VLLKDDFDSFFKYAEDADACFALFPAMQPITLAVVTHVVHVVHLNRKELYAALFDRENMAKVLTQIVGTLYWIVMLFVLLLIFGVNIQQFLLPFGTLFLGLSFIFGNSMKDLWEGFIMIFIVRPFDIGDRIDLTGYPPFLLVSKINLFTTELFAMDGRQYIIPNQHLYSNSIVQLRRSQDHAVQINLEIQFATPLEKIDQLKDTLIEWMKNDSVSSRQ